MPLGIVNDEEFERELKDSSTQKPIHKDVIIKDINNPGRQPGDNNVPDSLRKIIGESGIQDRQEALAIGREFGISPSSVSAYTNGSTSTKSYDKQPNLNHLNQIRERITRKARNKLIKSLDHITDEKLADAKAETLANVARSMSAIVKDMEPESPKNEMGQNGPTFIFYSPKFHEEKYFEHIFVQDNK